VTIIEDYRLLLAEVDNWFIRCQNRHSEEIVCSKGCSECCRGLFDISILDAALLNAGIASLPDNIRSRVQTRALELLQVIQSSWPEFSPPFTINHRPENEIDELMQSDNETACVLLGDDGRCLLYDYRPMTCRLHGLPLVDFSGEVMESDWCTKNFTGCDPLQTMNLRGDFNQMLRKEATLGRYFTEELLGKPLGELDTFIATALLLEFKDFDWRVWFERYQLKT